MKLGACSSIDHLTLAKSFGYDHAELSATEIMAVSDEEWPQIKEKILQAAIPILGFCAFADEKTPIIGPHADHRQWEAYLDKVLDRASQLHCVNIGIGAPKARQLPAGYRYEQATEEMETFLRIAAQKASQYNINILYEALHPNECNFGNHIAEIYQSVKRINMPNLKIVYDVFHAINAHETFEDARPFFEKVGHVHICSWNRQYQRFYLLPKDLPYLQKLSAFLCSVRYDGTLSIEAPDNNFMQQGLPALQMLNEIFKQG